MAINPKSLPQIVIVHILIGRGTTPVGIVVPAFPFTKSIRFLIIGKNKTSGMACNQMLNGGVVFQNISVEKIGFQGNGFPFLLLGKNREIQKNKYKDDKKILHIFSR